MSLFGLQKESYALVAQWIRASGFEPEGRGFDPLRAHNRVFKN